MTADHPEPLGIAQDRIVEGGTGIRALKLSITLFMVRRAHHERLYIIVFITWFDFPISASPILPFNLLFQKPETRNLFCQLCRPDPPS